MISELENQIKRLDAMCDVVAAELVSKSGNISAATVRGFVGIAARVVGEYFIEKEKYFTEKGRNAKI